MSATTRTVIRAIDGSSYVSCPNCAISVAAARINEHNCKEGILTELEQLVRAVEILAPAGKKTPAKKRGATNEEKPEKAPKKPKAEKGEENEKPEKKAKAVAVAAPKTDAGSGKQKKKFMLDGQEVKRNKNPYMLFADAKRADVTAEIAKDYEGPVPLQEVSKILGQRWKEMSAEDKAPFESEAAAGKARYEEELTRATVSMVDAKGGKAEGKAKKAKAVALVMPNGQEVKKPRSPYILFSIAMRTTVVDELKAADPNFKNTEVMRELGVRWSKLSAEEKRPYEDEAEADKARYNKECQLARGDAAESKESGDEEEEKEAAAVAEEHEVEEEDE